MRRNHFVGFDNAYQGFASGDLEKDAYAIRLFANNTDRMCVFQSYAKNFGLYGERAGCLTFVTGDDDEAARVKSRMKLIARPMYSNPPIHGAKLVDEVLTDVRLTKMWHNELKEMSERIQEMRSSLVRKLAELGSPHDWSHINRQIGMFAYTGLLPNHVEMLREDYHIFMTNDGRISMSGLNTANIDYVAESFHHVTKNEKM
jgi:aspartate aminotransferase